MSTVDFTDEEHAAVTAAVRRAIAEDRYPLSPSPLGGGRLMNFNRGKKGVPRRQSSDSSSRRETH
jgi:hypothetical protein